MILIVGYQNVPIHSDHSNNRGGRVIHSNKKPNIEFREIKNMSSDLNGFLSEQSNPFLNIVNTPIRKSLPQFEDLTHDSANYFSSDSICHGALYLSEYRSDTWLPLVSYVDMIEGKNNSKSIVIYNNTEINISVSCKYAIFESGLRIINKKLLWKNKRTSTPFFIKIDKDSPQQFPLTLVLQVNSIMICRIDIHINFSNLQNLGNPYDYPHKWIDIHKPIFKAAYIFFSEYETIDNYKHFKAVESMIDNIKDYIPLLDIIKISNSLPFQSLKDINYLQLFLLSPLRNHNNWTRLSNQNYLLESLVSNENKEYNRKLVVNISQFNDYEYSVVDDTHSDSSKTLNSTCVCFNDDLANQLWIYSDDNLVHLRNKFVNACKSIFRFISDLVPRSGPNCMLLMPANLKTHVSFKHKASSIYDILYYSANQPNSLWHLYFFCDDNSSPLLLEIPFNRQFFTDISPFVCLSLSMILAYQFSSGTNISLPFSLQHVAKLFDKEGLITLFNFFTEFDRKDNGYSMKPSGLADAEYNSLILILTCIEKSLKRIEEFDVAILYNKVYLSLNSLVPNWVQKSNLSRIDIDNKIYWISKTSSQQSWKFLYVISAESYRLKEPDYLPFLQSEMKENSSNIKLPIDSTADKLILLPKISGNQKENDDAMNLIIDNLMNEVGIKEMDSAIEIALKLLEHGCKDWDDFLSMRLMLSGIDKANQSERIIHFLQETKLPLFIRAKLTSYLMNK